jgi:hypothetical protein
MSSLSRWADEAERRHAEQVAAGKHDRLCEWGPRIYGEHPGKTFNHMCHCPKRRRIASGSLVLPGEVEWNAPSCPTCGDDLDNDGDSWTCSGCHVSWDQRGESAQWTDEYGDLGTAATS